MLLHFTCSILESETYSHFLTKGGRGAKSPSPQPTRESVHILYTGNCTGEYFGIGPICRCQEAMRYFNSHLKTHEWFIFVDDDIFIRPFALLSMLESIHSVGFGTNISDQYFGGYESKANLTLRKMGMEPLALVSSSRYRGFRGSKWKDLVPVRTDGSRNVSCELHGIHDFAYAQPAFINRSFSLIFISIFIACYNNRTAFD